MIALICLISAILWSMCARIGVQMASGGDDHVPEWKTFAAALVGSAMLSLAFDGDDRLAQLFAALLGGGLFAGAIVDRETGWAPDLLMFPIVLLSMALGGAMGGWSASPLIMAGLGILGYVGLHLVWLVILWRRPEASLPPPGDLLALALPLMIFGICYTFVAVMLSISILLALALRFQAVRNIFSRQDVIDSIKRESESGCISERHHITFLALSFPVTGMSLALAQIV